MGGPGGKILVAPLPRLVLRPLGIAARLAQVPADLDGVAIGIPAYHPGWVYPGLMIGPLRGAALLLDRLMTGALLPPELLDQMRAAHLVGGPIQGRPWRTPAYGLGLMCGIAANGA